MQIGATVWDCGLTLCKFAELQSVRFKGKRIIEVGAGTGLVGLLLAKLGASVLFTDQPHALPLLAHNVLQNLSQGGADGGASST